MSKEARDLPLDQWREWARQDNWHCHFVGSDIRQMLSEIERLRAELGMALLSAPLSADDAGLCERLRGYVKDGDDFGAGAKHPTTIAVRNDIEAAAARIEALSRSTASEEA